MSPFVSPVVTFVTSLFHDDLVKTTIHNHTFNFVTVIIMKNHESTRKNKNTVNYKIIGVSECAK